MLKWVNTLLRRNRQPGERYGGGVRIDQSCSTQNPSSIRRSLALHLGFAHGKIDFQTAINIPCDLICSEVPCRCPIVSPDMPPL